MPTITHPEEQLLLDCFFSYSWFDSTDYGRQAELRGISEERAKKLLGDWKKAGWLELDSRYSKVFDIIPTEDFFWEMGDRYPNEIFKAEAQRRGERFARVNRNTIHVDVMFGIFTACADLKNGKSVEDQTAEIRKLMDEPDGRRFLLSFKKTIKAWMDDPKFRPMFGILPDEVMNEWAMGLAKKSFDLRATGIFSVELPAKQLSLIQACAPKSTINRLYSLRNGFWLSESPWAYVDTMHNDWPRMILTAMRQLVMENDPAAAFKTARAAQKASLCTRTFPEITANWFYGLILYANRDSAQVLRTIRAILKADYPQAYSLPLYVWCWFAVNENVVQKLAEAKIFNPQFANKPVLHALVGLTLLNRGIEDDDWVRGLSDPARLKTFPPLLTFEVLHALKPESEACQRKAKAYGFASLLPARTSALPEWERLLDQLIGEEKLVNPSRLERIVYQLDCRDLTVKPRAQKSKDGRTWSRGRDVAISTFVRGGVEGMSVQDKAVSSLAGEIYGGLELRGPRVVDALVGHPEVYDAVTNERLDVVRQAYELKVLKKRKGFEIDDNIEGEFELFTGYAVKREGSTVVVIPLDPTVYNAAKIMKGVDCFPEEAADKLKTLLGSISGRAVVMSDLINENIETVDGCTVPTMRFELSDDNRFSAKLFVHPVKGEALSCAPGEGLEFLQTRIKQKSVQVRRDLKAEKAAGRKVAKAMPAEAVNAEGTEWSLNSLECLSALEALRKLGKTVEVKWPEDAVYTVQDAPISMDALSLSVTSMDRWFTVEGTVRVNSKLKLKIVELLEKLRDSTMPGFIELSDGRFVAVTESLRRLLGLVEGLSQKKRGKVTMPVYSGAVLDELEAAGVAVDGDEAARTLIERVREAADVVEPVPEHLQADLREYQVEGFRWMSRLAHWGAGGILADDMGLGKTVQAIAFLLSRANHGASLVVMPTSVLLNWEREIKRFAPSLRPVIFNREDRAEVVKTLGAGDVLLSTYGLLPNEIENLKTVDWNVIVLDEAHTIKSKETKTSKAAMELTSDARLLLTGTPLQNHLSELWNLSEFANPGLLGGYTSFVERFVVPVEKLHDKERQRLLKRMISPFLLRRTKTDVLEELPEKTDITLRVELSEAERALYEGLREDTAKALETGEIKPMEALAALMKLRQAACHPQLVNPKLTMGSSKTDAFLELVDELRSNGHRALVFSQFTSHLALIKKALDERGIEYLYLDGAVSAAQRTKLTESFRLGSMPLFLISLKAGGTGLNLTAADYVIHLDPWWNPAIEDQASDRAYRIGQERPVTVYRLVAEGTIEEKILRLHDTKRSLADALLEGADMSSRLSKEMLLGLLSNQAVAD